jgi:hypothetical protein
MEEVPTRQIPTGIRELIRQQTARETEENRRCWQELRPHLTPEMVATLSVVTVPSPPIRPTEEKPKRILEEIRDSVNQIWTGRRRRVPDQGDGTGTKAATRLLRSGSSRNNDDLETMKQRHR